jgi:sulfur relay (sulfurtransferase) complex TusBCD TusD component (DsrE family)
MKRGTIITLVAVVLFGALLLFNTLSAQKVECSVCVEFNGRRNCATASHENESEARQAAQTTACGTLTSGMNETIACGRVVPASAQCRTK